MSMKSLLLVAILALGGLSALAAPNFLGPTGLILIPTADALAADELSTAVYGTEGGHLAAYDFNYGIRENLEVGFTRLSDKSTIVNGKYNFQPEVGRRIGVAMGVIDLTDTIDTSLYVVASKKFDTNAPGITNIRLHAGLASGGKKSSNIPLDGFFAGLSIDITNRVVLMAEHDGNNFNFGGSILFGKGVQANIGVVGTDNTILYGLSYNTKL